MNEWSTAAEWTTAAGVEFRIEHRWNDVEQTYEAKFCCKAGDTWFVRDRWETLKPVKGVDV